jgi:GrpB-like predicted nucleotidyltransferase (UPF0157 family)
MNEEELRKITIGEPQQLNGFVALLNYDPIWPLLFEQQSMRIQSALGDRALLLEHVGSTSVPNLAAKPIIDILLVVTDSSDESNYVPALEAVGYVLRIREPDWHQHRMLKGSDKPTHLHCFSAGCPEIQRMVRFRDWLRSHESDRLLYERTKRDLATRTWKFVQEYADAKTAVVEDILARANRASLP